MKEIVSHFKGKNVYVTFDIDGLDASRCSPPARRSRAGYSGRNRWILSAKWPRYSNFVGADVNELAPKPNLHACNFLAAKLAYKILTYAFLVSRKNKAGK